MEVIDEVAAGEPPMAVQRTAGVLQQFERLPILAPDRRQQRIADFGQAGQRLFRPLPPELPVQHGVLASLSPALPYQGMKVGPQRLVKSEARLDRKDCFRKFGSTS